MSNPFGDANFWETTTDRTHAYGVNDSMHLHNGKSMRYSYQHYKTSDAAKGPGIINKGVLVTRTHQYRPVRLNAHTFVHRTALRINHEPVLNTNTMYEDVIGNQMVQMDVDLEWNGTNYVLPANFFTDPSIDKQFIVKSNTNITEWQNPGSAVVLNNPDGDIPPESETEVYSLEALLGGDSLNIEGILSETELITALKNTPSP